MSPNRPVGARYGRHENITHAPAHAKSIGATKLCLFLATQEWGGTLITKEDAKQFQHNLEKCSYSSHNVVVHASYNINCCAWHHQYRERTRNRLIAEAMISHYMGIPLINIHIGGTPKTIPRDKALSYAAEMIDAVCQEIPDIEIAIENSEGSDTRYGGTFDDIAHIIHQSRYQHRLGASLNLAHAFVQGYDFRTLPKYEQFMRDLDRLFGRYLIKIIFMNDSKTSFGSKVDAHENLGQGQIGKKILKYFCADEHNSSIPFILETPNMELWKNEIAFIRAG